MLREIKELLKARVFVSLSDLAIRFNVEESALEKMMEMLTRQGSVEKEKSECCGGSCGGCGMNGCCSSGAVSYRWSG